MRKYVDLVLLALFAAKLVNPVHGCEPNSACGDEAIHLAFAIIGGIVFTSIILLMIYFCLKHTIKRRESRDNACNCSHARWGFTDNENIGRNSGRDRNNGGNFGDDEYEWGNYFNGGYDCGIYGDEAGRSLITAQVPRQTMIRVHTPTGDVLCC